MKLVTLGFSTVQSWSLQSLESEPRMEDLYLSLNLSEPVSFLKEILFYFLEKTKSQGSSHLAQ